MRWVIGALFNVGEGGGVWKRGLSDPPLTNVHNSANCFCCLRWDSFITLRCASADVGFTSSCLVFFFFWCGGSLPILVLVLHSWGLWFFFLLFFVCKVISFIGCLAFLVL